MGKKNLVPFITIAIITAVLFFGGVLGNFFIIKHLINLYELQKSDIVEEAIINNKYNSYGGKKRVGYTQIYFTTINDNKKYNFKIYHSFSNKKINIGDKVKVYFNDDKTLFLFENYYSLIFRGYIFQVLLLLVCIGLSIYSLRATIDLYRLLRKNE